MLYDVGAGMCVTAERALTKALGASCNTAVGAHAIGPGATGRPMRLGYVQLTGWVGLPDGSEWISDTFVGSPIEVGGVLAERMIAVGARELLDGAERVHRQ
jgi:porphobilinogen deaminase